MLELPEAATLAEQINETLVGRTIIHVIANHSPHKFAWFHGDPDEYEARLSGKVIKSAIAYGGLVEIQLDRTRLLLGDGVGLRYFGKGEKLPKKHQLMIEFDDGSVAVASVQMYGGICCFDEGEYENSYYEIAKEKPSPLTNAFNESYFDSLISDETIQKKSAKAFLATEQRIPGLGNGVLQDILLNAKIHPKRKVETLSENEKEELYHSIKATLSEMTLKGGRDTEKDIFGCYGGYKTKLSKKTLDKPCSICGGNIVKKAYMGGSIYYCETCQEI